MDQRIQKRLRAELDEGFQRQVRRMDDDPPAVPVEAIVVVLPERTCDFLRELLMQGLHGDTIERVAENLIYSAFRDSGSHLLQTRLKRIKQRGKR